MHPDLVAGKKLDFGVTVFSENDIIDFAKAFDPLDFHTDIEVAKKSFFKGLVASGPHIFNYTYRKHWVPLFGKTVLAGKEILNWKFLKPIYANQKISCTCEIRDMKINPEKNFVEVTWFYDYRNEKQEQVQTVLLVVLHKIS